jgi:hypothetical protein
MAWELACWLPRSATRRHRRGHTHLSRIEASAAVQIRRAPIAAAAEADMFGEEGEGQMLQLALVYNFC